MDVKCNFDMINYHEIQNLIEKIVYLTRKHLLYKLTMYGRYHHPFDFYNLEDYCEVSSDLIKSFCKSMHIKCQKYRILYGF